MKRFHVHVHVEDLGKSIGFQTDDPAELAELKARAESADMALLDEGETTCCYARSEKQWVTDPQGIAWEHFHTLGNIPVFSEAATPESAATACCAPTSPPPAAGASAPPAANPTACCTPAPRGKPIGIPVKSQSSCC